MGTPSPRRGEFGTMLKIAKALKSQAPEEDLRLLQVQVSSSRCCESGLDSWQMRGGLPTPGACLWFDVVTPHEDIRTGRWMNRCLQPA